MRVKYGLFEERT